jgi:beta-alanine--pyruvate transaminase
MPAHGAELADDVERLVALHGADTIAAVIVEPVPGSTAVLPPPKTICSGCARPATSTASS